MILCLLPAADYDPTESSLPWAALRQAGIEVQFATPEGKIAFADQRLVETGFGLLNPFFMTRKTDLAQYRHMCESAAFRQPLCYADVIPENFEGLLVPGGHAAGMRSLLEAPEARRIVQHFFHDNKPVAAVCHGVLLLARTPDPRTGKSVLHGRKTTALPRSMELAAWFSTALWLGRYYRTYPQSVETEVKAALAKPSDFSAGPLLPIRDASDKLKPGFVVRDGNYLSARWPGDCHLFAKTFAEMLLAYRKAKNLGLRHHQDDWVTPMNGLSAVVATVLD